LFIKFLLVLYDAFRFIWLSKASRNNEAIAANAGTPLPAQECRTMITQCCQCRRVRQEGAWIEPSESMLNNARVSHGYCPDCALVAFQAVDDDIASKEVLSKGGRDDINPIFWQKRKDYRAD
jgi:hypothetical protein